MANKRIKKKMGQVRRKKIHQILDLVLEINRLKATTQDMASDAFTASFHFSGVSCYVEVQVYKEDKDKNEVSIWFHAPVGRTPYSSLQEKTLDEVLNGLKKIKREGKRHMDQKMELEEGMVCLKSDNIEIGEKMMLPNGKIGIVTEKREWKGRASKKITKKKRRIGR